MCIFLQLQYQQKELNQILVISKILQKRQLKEYDFRYSLFRLSN